MQLFLDTANLEDIKKYAHLIDGVTTNPTLIARDAGGISFKEHIRKIIGVVDGPISVEVVSPTVSGMVNEARKYASFSKNVVIKVPMTGQGLLAAKKLSGEGIRTNVTLVFSANQALLAAKAGATYASIFVGRLDDTGEDGMSVVSDTLAIYESFGFETQVITASIRHPLHVRDAAIMGSHVATVPPSVLELMMNHPLTDIGVSKFLDDWKRVNK
jgi:transaldolase